MNKTTSRRYELQQKAVETPVKSSRKSTWRKLPDDIHTQIGCLKLQLLFVRLQRYTVGNSSGVFCRSMAFMAREFGVSRRTMQRAFDRLEECGLAHRQERRVARNRNAHNRYTLLTMDELFAGVRLSSSGRRFVTGKDRENLSTKASTTRPRRSPSSRGMKHIDERKRDPNRVQRFAAVREWQENRRLREVDRLRRARLGVNPYPSTPLTPEQLAVIRQRSEDLKQQRKSQEIRELQERKELLEEKARQYRAELARMVISPGWAR